MLPPPGTHLVKVKVLNSTKANIFWMDVYQSLQQVRKRLQLWIQLSDYHFTMPDQTIISKLSEGQITLKMILDKNTFYLNEPLERSEKYIQLDQKGKKLQKDLEDMHNIYKEKQSTFKAINRRYTGEINKDGLYQGLGKLSFDDGAYYIGNFKGGSCNGLGILINGNGIIVRGEWKNNQVNGLAFYVYSNGARIVSVYCSHNTEGQGIVYFLNGQILEGWIEDNKLEGEAIRRYPNGAIKIQYYKKSNKII